MLNKIAAHKALGLYALANVILMVLIVAKLGWISVVALFLSFFFMSIMFPTIFALGIHGLGSKSKVASSFIVMAIMGGALLPKLMGKLGDDYGMSAGFAVPAVCFLIIALYGGLWTKLSGCEGLLGKLPNKGH
jgi:FHS family L-fucose permease-like MFS transporter